jgi:hypothetical protein
MEELSSFVGADRVIEGEVCLAGETLDVIFNQIYKIKRKRL